MFKEEELTFGPTHDRVNKGYGKAVEVTSKSTSMKSL